MFLLAVAAKQLWRRKILKAVRHFGDQGVEVNQILLPQVWRGGRRPVFISKYDRLHVGILTAVNKFYRQSGQKMGHWPVGAYGVRSEHIRFIRLSKVLFTTSICASKFCCHRGLREKSPKVFGQRYEIKLDN